MMGLEERIEKWDRISNSNWSTDEEIGNLAQEFVDNLIADWRKVTAERDAALAECERLRQARPKVRIYAPALDEGSGIRFCAQVCLLSTGQSVFNRYSFEDRAEAFEHARAWAIENGFEVEE